jgi:hypothetical protein
MPNQFDVPGDRKDRRGIVIQINVSRTKEVEEEGNGLICEAWGTSMKN